MSPEGLRLLFVGPGRAGLSLGYAWVQADAVAELTYAGRHPEPPAHPLFVQGTARYHYGLVRPEPRTDAVLLSVPDESIHDVAQGLAALGPAPPGCAAYHLCGAMSADVLAPLHERGYSVGTLHPFQLLAHPVTAADVLPGSTFAVSGEPRARATALALLGALGSPAVEVPAGRRPLYDAACVLGSSYLGVLLEITRSLLIRAGLQAEQASAALRRLVSGTVAQEAADPARHDGTGPISRGDLETVELHLRALEGTERRLYAALGAAAVAAGDAEPLGEHAAREIQNLFQEE